MFDSYAEKDHIFQFEGFPTLNSGLSGLVLKPWEERKQTTMELPPDVQMNEPCRARAAAFQPSPLPGSEGDCRFSS